MVRRPPTLHTACRPGASTVKEADLAARAGEGGACSCSPGGRGIEEQKVKQKQDDMSRKGRTTSLTEVLEPDCSSLLSCPLLSPSHQVEPPVLRLPN